MDGVDERHSPTPPIGQHQHQKRTCDVLQNPDIFTRSRQGWRRVVDGARWLAHEVDSDLVVVNTSGLLAGPGRRLKADKIAAIQPDRLIAIGGGSDLENIIGDHPTVPVLCLARSPVARRKTDAARRARRQQAFRNYFVDAGLQVFARGLVPGTLQSQIQAGVLVGLTDEQATDLGLGLIVEAFGPTALSVLTPVVSGSVHQVTPGSVCVREDFSEVRLSQDEQR